MQNLSRGTSKWWYFHLSWASDCSEWFSEDTFKDWLTCMHTTSPDRTFPSNCKLHVSIGSRPPAPLLPWKLKAPLRLAPTTLMKSQCACLCVCPNVTARPNESERVKLLPASPALHHLRYSRDSSSSSCHFYPFSWLSTAALHATVSIPQSGGSITATSDY